VITTTSTTESADVLTPADVAERFGKSESWVTAEARAGRLPGSKVGRSWRFTEVDLIEYLGRTRRNGVVEQTATPQRRRRRAA
jgi:excisionase family DNA binding protein